MLARCLGKEVLDRAVALGFACRQPVGVAGTDQRKVFGQDDQLGTGGGGLRAPSGANINLNRVTFNGNVSATGSGGGVFMTGGFFLGPADFYERLRGLLKGALVKGCAMGLFGSFDPEIVSQAALGGLKEVALQWIVRRRSDSETLRRVCREILSYSLRGMLSRT